MKGVLLVNLGTPDSPSRGDVYKYLKQFLLDERVLDIPWVQRNMLVRGYIAPIRSKDSSNLYKELWTENGSPLKYYGEILTKGVQETLGADYMVELGMRYQNPSIESALNKLLKANVSELLILPLFPQYASASTGSVYEEVMRLLMKRNNIPQIKFINSFYDYDPMIEVFADNARKHDISSYDHVLFSYHGLPERQIKKGDDCNHCFKEGCCNKITPENQHCYRAHCFATTRLIAAKLNLKEEDYTVCFQSRLGSTPWIKPYTTDVLKIRAAENNKRLLVFSPAFIADCLETTVEISDEYQEEFEEMGGEKVQLVESLNDNPKWIKGVADLIVQNF